MRQVHFHPVNRHHGAGANSAMLHKRTVDYYKEVSS